MYGEYGYLGVGNQPALGSWFSDIVGTVAGPIKYGIQKLVPGGGAIIAAAEQGKSLWDRVRGQGGGGSQPTDADVVNGMQYVTDATRQQVGRQLAGQGAGLNASYTYGIPTPLLYGGLGLGAFLLLSKRRQNPPRGARRRRRR